MSTSGNCQRCVFFRMYLSPAFEVFNRLFNDNLGFMGVERIEKHLLGFTQSNYSAWALLIYSHLNLNRRELKAAVSIFDLVHPYRYSLLQY